jgi:hypothetical protein
VIKRNRTYGDGVAASTAGAYGIARKSFRSIRLNPYRPEFHLRWHALFRETMRESMGVLDELEPRWRFSGRGWNCGRSCRKSESGKGGSG